MNNTTTNPDEFWFGTFNDMLDQDILDHGMGRPHLTNGFSLGKRGTAKFWMWDPTPNGYYKLYSQNEAGDITGIRYIDGSKQLVKVWKAV